MLTLHSVRAAVEAAAAAAARDGSGPGSPACYARGRPDGQLRIAEPICLTASRTDVLPHATPSEDVGSEHVSMSQVPAGPEPASPRAGQRPFSAPNVYTVYTGHCCCRHRDWFSVPENMTFVTSYPLGVLHTPAIAAHSQEARAGLCGLEQQGTGPPLAGTDFALNRPSPLPPQAFN